MTIQLLEVEFVEAAILRQRDGVSEVELHPREVTDYVTEQEAKTLSLDEEVAEAVGHFCSFRKVECSEAGLVVGQHD